MSINLFGGNEYDRLKRANEKRMKHATKEDRDLLNEIIRELDIRGASRAYTEVIKTDLVNQIVAEQHSAHRIKRPLKELLGNDVNDVISEAMDYAPLRKPFHKFIMQLGDSFFNMIITTGVIAFLLNAEYRFRLNIYIYIVLLASILGFFIISNRTGRNAETEEGRRKSSGTGKLGVFTLSISSTFICYSLFSTPVYIHAWAPVIISILGWFACYSWNSAINKKELDEIQQNYE